MSVFNELNAINVSNYIEKKNGLSYLSWTYAWQEVKKRYPESYYTIYEGDNGCLYRTDGKTCWVKTGVTIVWYELGGECYGTWKEGAERKSLEHIEMLPVMDFKNKSIPVDNVTSMDANKAVQRSLTKAIARHGIGLYVYAGEDLPEQNFEDAEKERRELDALKDQVKQLCVENTVGMDDAQKKQFIMENIKPILGMANYVKCDNAAALTKLVEHLTSLKKTA